MPIPVVEGFTYNSAGGTTATSVTLTKPAGVQVGELLILLCGNEDNTASTSFAAITGWTKAYEHGNATPDTKIGMYWRIADGTEGASETVDWSATSGDAGGGWYLRVSGIYADDPVHILGSSQQSAGASSLAALSLTTTLDDCLIFSHMSGDGADTYPFSSSGTGWPTTIPTNQEIQDTTETNAWAGAWITRSLATAGASGNHTWGMNVSDGIVTKQFAIAPAQEGISSIDPTEFNMDTADVDINGLNFSGSGNTVYLSDVSILDGSPDNKVDVSSAINTESTTLINLNFTQLSAAELTNLHTLGPGQRYLIVVTTNSPIGVYSSTAITLHRPDAFVMSLSSNFAPGSTTQRLTGLTGTFAGGRIEEALNPSTTNTDVAADGNREDVWNIQAKANSRAVSYDFRVLYGGNVADTITQTPQATVTDVTAYTLTADAGSYAYTGSTANLEHDRILDAAGGTYSYSGVEANLEYGRVLSSDGGSYSYTGNDAGLVFDRLIGSEAGSYAYSGTDASLEHNYVIDSEAGSYIYTGQTADLSYGLAVIASSGSYAYTGQDVTLTYVPVGGYSLTAESGNYAYSGQDANLEYGRLLEATTGAYSYTGQDAQLLGEWLLDAWLGDYTYTGQNADLIYVPAGGYILTADAGNYIYSGQSANLEYGRVLGASGGNYTYSGQTANLIYDRLLNASAGNYAYTGQDAGLLYERLLAADAGVYSYTGQDANLVYVPAGAYILTADTGSYAYSGQDASFLYSRVMGVDAGSYAYSGQASNLYYGRQVGAESGSYIYAGNVANFLYSRVFDVETGNYAYTGNSADLSWSGATGPEEPGLEYSFIPNRLHYSVNNNYLHYCVDINRLHYRYRDE